MKIEDHLRKARSLENTMKKLNLEEDYETILENCVLASSHLINAAMHKIGTLTIDRDIKHTKLPRELKKMKGLRERSEEVSNLLKSIEDLRPSHVYGKGTNGDVAREVLKTYEKMKKVVGIEREA